MYPMHKNNAVDTVEVYGQTVIFGPNALAQDLPREW